MSSDECFEKFIEYIDSDASEKYEPSTSQRKRQRIEKTTDVQFEKLCTFMNSHSKKDLGKETFNRFWDALVSEMNDLGPPSRTSEDWKKVWSSYKSKNLKKRKPSSSSKSEASKLVVTRLPKEKHSSPSATVVEIKPQRFAHKEHHTTSSLSPLKDASESSMKVVEKLDVIIAQNQKINENLETMIALGRMTFKLLKRRLKK